MTDLEDVCAFWENNPLWTGESAFEAGTQPFFEEHRSVYVADCFAGHFDIRILPPRNAGQEMKILDLGSGIGFWVTEFALRGLHYLHFFPARALPFKLPKMVHRWLDRNLVFIIYAIVRKA